MTKLTDATLDSYINEQVETFHQKRLKKLSEEKLKELVRRKNPYLFRTKNVQTAREYVLNILDAKLSSSEEAMFGRFLEKLGLFIVSERFGGNKSTSRGLDLDFKKDGVRHLVSVKSGEKWGNSSSIAKQKTDFRKALDTVKQDDTRQAIELVLGSCYGNSAPRRADGILMLSGQAFWDLLTDDPIFYQKIISKLGTKAAERNAEFLVARERIVERLTEEFEQLFL